MKIRRPPSKNFERPLSGDIESQFLSFLSEQGMEVDPRKGLVVDGSIGRAYINLGGERKLSGWYQLWMDQSVPFGRVGDYRISTDQPTAIWKPENRKRQTVTKTEREEIDRLKKEVEVKKAEKHTKSAKRSQAMWEKGEDCEKHPYLETKGVLSYGLKVDENGLLMIPMLNNDLTVVGMQFISDDGTKRFLTGSKKAGSFFILGQEILKTSDTIYYGEGYATCADIYRDMSCPVFVSFDAYNLSKVAESVFETLKDRRHIFVADNDDSKTGEKEAIKACQWIVKQGGMAEVHMPETKGDYNDHKSVSGEVIPALKFVDVPTDVDFVTSEKGRMLNLKENVLGVMKTHNIHVNYNVIKKRMEIEIPHMNFIADMKEEASLVEIEDRCIKMGVPHTRVRDYLKVIANEYNPVIEWIESKPWDGTSRIGEFLKTITSSTPEALKDMLLSLIHI